MNYTNQKWVASAIKHNSALRRAVQAATLKARLQEYCQPQAQSHSLHKRPAPVCRPTGR